MNVGLLFLAVKIVGVVATVEVYFILSYFLTNNFFNQVSSLVSELHLAISLPPRAKFNFLTVKYVAAHTKGDDHGERHEHGEECERRGLCQE